MKRVVLSSGAVNRFKYRIIPEGVRHENYGKNPVLLGFHYEKTLPIGRVEDIMLEGGKLTGALVFDENDPVAAEFKRKFDEGFLNAVSIYHEPINTSDDPALMMPGQTGPTVLETELIEVSVVSIGADPGALKLSYANQPLEIPTIYFNKNNDVMTQEQLQKLAAKLGLATTATPEQILGRVDAITQDLNNALAARVDALMLAGEAKGFITADNKAHYRKLGMSDYTTVENLINTHKAASPAGDGDDADDPNKLSMKVVLDAVKKLGAEKNEPADDKETFDWLQKHDPNKLNHIRLNEPEKYQALSEAYVKSKSN